MPFDDFQKHCPKCKKGKPCGGYHIYAIRLEKSIWKKKKFRKANPNYKEGRPCLYIGKTQHVARCRQSQHQSRRTGTDKDRWTCYCGKDSASNKYESFINNPSKFIRGHTKGLLSPRHFRDWNPVTKENATEVEQEVARTLRDLNYGVWAGHHDS